jgi:hypothetical protein
VKFLVSIQGRHSARTHGTSLATDQAKRCVNHSSALPVPENSLILCSPGLTTTFAGVLTGKENDIYESIELLATRKTLRKSEKIASVLQVTTDP